MMRHPGLNKNVFTPPEKVREMTDDEVDVKAFYDHETATFNFRYLVRCMRRELTRAHRYKRPLSLVVLIIDNYKMISMEYGVLAIESAMQEAAEAIITSCRADVDMVGRYGEDRYIVLLPETPGVGAGALAERVRKKFEDIVMRHQWHEIKLSASIGVAHFPGHGKDIESLIAQADVAAETAQERGGNRVCFAPEEVETGQS